MGRDRPSPALDRARRLVSALISATLLAAPAARAQAPGLPAEGLTDVVGLARALDRASSSVIGVQVKAVDDARSASTLGTLRQGSGVVIDADGLVLTIGYLILEAEQVRLVLDDERTVPARVVAYDLATGFGLVRALSPLKLEPVPLGTSSGRAHGEPMLIASGGPDAEVSNARLMAQRAFAGYWEYRIDGALFTSPPRTDHSGAGLFNARGELVGIGSLVVQNTLAIPDGPAVPGNMFVPVHLLVPILDELKSRGLSSASHRAWLGVNCVEQGGQVRVVRVSSDSPAEVAGLEPGDRIERIDGVAVTSLDALWTSLWAGGGAEREVVLDIRRGESQQAVKVQSVDRMKTLRRAEGI